MLIYDLPRFATQTALIGVPPFDFFHDGENGWFNYEDWLSRNFAAPTGPGIGYLDDLPVRLFHCDRKIAQGSAYYRRDLAERIEVFHERRRECEAL